MQKSVHCGSFLLKFQPLPIVPSKEMDYLQFGCPCRAAQNRKMQIQKLTSQDINDFIELIRIFAVVFEMSDFEMPKRQHLNSLIANPDFLVFVAKVNGKVIGGLTGYVINGYYSEKPTAYIYDVGVSPGHQRKGAGKMLICHLVEYCKENGFDDAYVEAEADDLQAVNFYKNTRYNSMLNAIHFTYNTQP